jgi:hypothetical protein
MRVIRRLAIWSICLLSTGIATTVAVAWLCAYIWPYIPDSDRRGAMKHDPPRVILLIREGSEIGVERVSVLLTVIEGYSRKIDTPVAEWISEYGQAPEWTLAHRSWSAGALQPHGVPSARVDATMDGIVDDLEYSWREYRFGWPLPCLGYAFASPMAGGPWQHGGITLPKWTRFWGAEQFGVTIPYRPSSRALMLNTIIYAALWAAVTPGLAFTRARFRRRRGRCPRCGYDLQGKFNAGCSECGWGREQESTTSSDTRSADPGVARSSA